MGGEVGGETGVGQSKTPQRGQEASATNEKTIT